MLSFKDAVKECLIIGSTADEVIAELKLYFKTDDVELSVDEEGRFLVRVEQRFVCITF